MCLLGAISCDTHRRFDASSENQDNPLAARIAGQHCETWEDPQGIPHIKAADELTAYTCWGYLHGRDRAFQLDYLRRTAQGRLSEILGKDALKGDFMLRVLSLPNRAKTIFADMESGTRDRLWAYAYGVNRGLAEATRKGVYEFRKLGYGPEAWRPEDSVVILMLNPSRKRRRHSGKR